MHNLGLVCGIVLTAQFHQRGPLGPSAIPPWPTRRHLNCQSHVDVTPDDVYQFPMIIPLLFLVLLYKLKQKHLWTRYNVTSYVMLLTYDLN